MNADETHNNTSMFGRLKIGTKILIVTVLISLTIIAAIGIISDLSTRGAFKTEAFNKLTAVREMKGQQIEEYFGIIAQQIRSLSRGKNAIEGVKIFKTSIKTLSPWIHMDAERKMRLHDFHRNAFGQEYQKNSGDAVPDTEMKRLIEIDEIAEYLQSAYIAENSHPIGQKNELARATDNTYYNSQHQTLHPYFKQYLEKFGFYDIFLIDNEDGRIIYSVFKEVDFGTSLLTGPYQDSNLAHAFNAARVSTDPDFVAVVDFEPYIPSYGAPAAFMASPIIDDGNIVGVLAFQMPVDQINDIMTSKQAWKDVGLGLSGETYLVGADKLLRNQSRFLIEDRENYLESIRDSGTPEETAQKIDRLNSTIGLQIVDTEGTRAALAGESSTRIFPDYRGVSVLSSYRPLKLPGLNWVIMSELDEAEAFQPFDKLRDRMIMLTSALLALTIYISYFFSLNLTRPLRFLEASAHALAEGRLDESIERSSNDEIGDLALSFETMRVALKQTFAEVEQQKNELEERVRDRTAELDAVLENIDYGILLMDDDLKSQMINRAFRDMWMVPDEFADSNPTMKELMYSHLPKGFYDFVPRRDFENYVNERTDAVLAGAVPLAVMDRSDGKAIQVQCVVLPGGGRIITYFDITAMKRKEEELAEKEAQLRLAFDNMPAGIKFIDKDKKIIAFNKQYLEVLGYPDDLIHEGGSSLDELKYQAKRGDLGSGNPADLVKKTLAIHGGDETVFIERELADGRVAAITIQNTPDGQRVTVVNDITERKKAEQAMHEVYQIFDQMPINVFVRNAEGRFKYINHAYEVFHKVKNDEIVGKTLLEVFPEQEKFFGEMDDEVIKEGRQLVTEEVFDTDSGTVTLSVIKFPISDLEGNRIAVAGLDLDITERKRIADELSEAKDAADEANRTKSAFLANMSHELRTPMNAIIGYAEMLAEDAEEEGNDDQLADLKEIMDAGEHLLSLVNDVLDISKIEAGRMDLFLETFDLTKMMDEVASTTKALVDKNKNKMVVSIADEIGEMHADVTKIRQILFNLMSNAAKFTSKGTITLFGERRSEASGDIIRLGVSDDGIGIPQDKLERIFEEFSQADDSTTKNFGGTGLGLALVKRFCQMMGGDVWVESTKGEGSSFILELPAVVIDVEKAETAETGQEIPKSEPGKPGIPTGEGSILVIDDDRNARNLIRRSLESEGHHVTVAENGDEGIALAHKIRPALITLDIIMPGRDGWSVLKELKDDPDLRDVPVIMVSIIDDKKIGSALGAVDHLNKPVDRARLITLVKRYTKKGRALIVENDAAVRKVVTRALVSIGWTSVEAENGAVGIEKFSNDKFDLIILDIMMPVMDGFGFIRELRLTEKGRSVPVVVLTAKDLTKEERKELNGNVEKIFLKEEASIDELVKEIGNQLAGKL